MASARGPLASASLYCECGDCRAWHVRKRNVTYALSLGMLVIGGLVISGLLR